MRYLEEEYYNGMLSQIISFAVILFVNSKDFCFKYMISLTFYFPINFIFILLILLFCNTVYRQFCYIINCIVFMNSYSGIIVIVHVCT